MHITVQHSICAQQACPWPPQTKVWPPHKTIGEKLLEAYVHSQRTGDTSSVGNITLQSTVTK